MEIHPLLNFASKDDNIQYWMDVANQMYQRKEDTEREFQEYQEHSQLLENELETSFEQSDKKNRELRQKNYKLSVDNEDLKNRLNEQIKIYDTIQSEVQNLKIYNDELLQNIRKLEQKNDDLERCNREKMISEKNLENQFNVTLEKLAILETEVDEVDNLKMTVYKLREENKDLRKQIRLALQKLNNNIDENTNDKKVKLADRTPQIEQKNTTINDKMEHENNAVPYDLLKCMYELEQKIDCSQKPYSSTTIFEENTKAKLKLAIKKIMSLEKDLLEKGSFDIDLAEEWKNESRDWSQEFESRLQSHTESSFERQTLSGSDTSKHQENIRNSGSDRLNRHVENRVKKVKDEEKRQQNLAWFLKRWRYSYLNWSRKKQ